MANDPHPPAPRPQLVYKYHIGELVRLRSGGPLMTIVEIEGTGHSWLITTWHFRANGRMVILECDSNAIEAAVTQLVA